MSQTKEIERSATTDETESVETGETDDVPSWSELLGRSSSIGTKKSLVGYSVGSAALFLGAMFLLPVSVGFLPGLLLVTFLSGLVGKSNLLSAGATGLVGGGVTSLITAGLAALTIMPILTGAAVGAVVGILGVLAGGLVRNKVR